MSEEMVERVARAMCEADGKNPDADWRDQRSGVMLDVADPSPENWRKYTKHARAAITAMREPTEAMIEASNREWDGRMSHRSSGAWQAMIDEALKS